MNPCDAIMCVYGKGQWTWQAIQSLLATAPINKIVVVDCGANVPAWSQARLASLSNVIYVPSENIGCNAAYNLAWSHTTTRHVIVAGTDSIFLPHWFLACWESIQHLQLGWVSPGQQQIAAWVPEPAWTMLRQPTEEYCSVGEFLSGTALMDWHRLRSDVGYYDERFFLAYGDMDYRIRMDAAGVQYGVTYPSRVMHLDNLSRAPLTAEQNVLLECWDEAAFRDKYRDRPDILDAFPPLPPIEYRLTYWQSRGLL